MKNILLIAFVIYTSITFAFDTVFAEVSSTSVNLKQVKFEKEIIPSYRMMARYALIYNDYKVYSENGSSIYEELLKIIKSNKANNNYQYAIKAKALYDKIVKTEAGSQLSAEEFNKHKIFIPDCVFDSLDKNLIIIISLLNAY